MYLVCGASGKTGSAVTDQLLRSGSRVRVFLRSEEKARAFAGRGAEVSIGTLEDVPALTAALKDMAGVYLMLPYDHESADFAADARRLVAGFARAVALAEVPRVVGLSSIGAHNETPIGPMVREQIFEQAFWEHPGARFLRAAYFVENWAGVLPAVRDGVLPTFLPSEVPVAMVSSADIGHKAAALLVSDDAPRITELAGPKDLSPADIAGTLGRILGSTVAPLPAPLAEVAPTFQRLGFSAHIAGLVREMYAAYAEGRVTFQGGEPARGVIPVEETLRDMLGV